MPLTNREPPAIARVTLPVSIRFTAGFVIVGIISLAWYFRQIAMVWNPESLVSASSDYQLLSVSIFVLVYAVAVTAALPTLPMNLAAGWLWGPFLGTAVSVFGAGSGAILAFAAARTIFGQPLRRHFDNHFLIWLQAEFDNKGWRLIAFLRLNPIFPSGLLNYFLGLTAMRAKTYVWATAVFLVPPTLVIAWVGSALGRTPSEIDSMRVVHTAVIVSAAIVLMVSIRYAARYFRS